MDFDLRELNLFSKYFSKDSKDSSFAFDIFLNSLGETKTPDKLLMKEIKKDLYEIIIQKKSEKFKLDRIKLIYKITEKEKEKEIKILGEKFIKINKNKCRLNINNKKYPLEHKIKFKNVKKNKIKLISLDNMTNLKSIH